MASIVLGLSLVNGASRAEPIAKPKDVEKFLADFLPKAEPGTFHPGIARILEVQPGSRQKFLALQTNDGKNRGCQVALKDDDSVDSILFSVGGRASKTRQEFTYYKLGPDGVLRLAVHNSGTLKDGKPVKGSGKPEKLDLESSGVKEQLKKELKFWLGGKYLKLVKPATD